MTAFGAPLDELLGLLQAEARDRADLLDHLDLLVAERGQDHVELGLLLDGGAASRPRRGDRDCGRRGGHAPLVFHLLDELGDLHRLELVDLREDVFNCRHVHVLSFLPRSD